MRLKALKDVLVKLGGTPDNERTCGEVIEKIADKAGGGGGGGGVCRVTITGDSDDESTWHADKTLAELKAAFESGQILECYNKIDYRNTILQLCGAGTSGTGLNRFDFKGEYDWDSSHSGEVTQWTHYEAWIGEDGVVYYCEAYFG